MTLISEIVAFLVIIVIAGCAYAGIRVQQEQKANASPSQPEPTDNVVKVGFDHLLSSYAGSDSSTAVQVSSPSVSRAAPAESLP